MSKTTITPTEVRPQEIKAQNHVTVTNLILSIGLTFFATATVVTIANWFLYTNIHDSARSAVIQDMSTVLKAQGR
jgi:hypothetical protein